MSSDLWKSYYFLLSLLLAFDGKYEDEIQLAIKLIEEEIKDDPTRNH